MMQPLTRDDLHFVVSRIPKYVRRLMTENPGACFLAGGFIRSTIARERVNDIDLFGPDKETLEGWAKDIVVDSKGAARLHETDNAYTLLWSSGRTPCQFIHRWTYKDAVHLVTDFDFTIAQAVIWATVTQEPKTEWHSVVSEHFYADLAGRKLRYTYPQRDEDVGGSLMRVRKFVAAGYSIQAPSLAGVVSRLVGKLDFQDERIEDERWRAQVLQGLLREVDPLMVVDGLELVDEHEIVEGKEE